MESATPPARLQIDLASLLLLVPQLEEVCSGKCTWDQFGAMVFRKHLAGTGKLRVIHDDLVKPVFHSKWAEAKQRFHSVLPSAEHPLGKIPNRFTNLTGSSTSVLLADLSLWLAGNLKLSVTLTRPMVAAMLLAIHQSDGNPDALLASGL